MTPVHDFSRVSRNEVGISHRINLMEKRAVYPNTISNFIESRNRV